MGQGKENARDFLAENRDIAQEIEERLFSALGISADDDVGEEPDTVETEAET